MKTRRAARSRHGSSGFTLLETVVTLVIVSLLIALLMQALSQALSIRTRLLRLQGEARTDYLQEAWFRESIAAAQADLGDGLGVMEGASARLDFVTSAPLVAQGLVRASWYLEPVDGGMALSYSDPATELVLIPGPLKDGSFSYLGPDGEWLPEWAPMPDDPQRLPDLIRFEASTPRGRLHWLVPLLSDSLPVANLRLDSDAGI